MLCACFLCRKMFKFSRCFPHCLKKRFRGGTLLSNGTKSPKSLKFHLLCRDNLLHCLKKRFRGGTLLSNGTKSPKSLKFHLLCRDNLLHCLKKRFRGGTLLSNWTKSPKFHLPCRDNLLHYLKKRFRGGTHNSNGMKSLCRNTLRLSKTLCQTKSSTLSPYQPPSLSPTPSTRLKSPSLRQ